MRREWENLVKSTPQRYSLYQAAINKSALVDMSRETVDDLVSVFGKLNNVYNERKRELGDVNESTIDEVSQGDGD